MKFLEIFKSKIQYGKIFKWWQNFGIAHPLTCGNSCGNLELKRIDDKNMLHLYCKHCDYTQIYNPELIVEIYKNYITKRKLKIKPFFRWYDIWIGLYIDIKNEVLYFIPIPMFGVKIYYEIDLFKIGDKK